MAIKQSKYPTADYYIKDLKGHQDLKDLWFKNRLKMTEKEYGLLCRALDDWNFVRAKEILEE